MDFQETSLILSYLWIAINVFLIVAFVKILKDAVIGILKIAAFSLLGGTLSEYNKSLTVKF